MDQDEEEIKMTCGFQRYAHVAVWNAPRPVRFVPVFVHRERAKMTTAVPRSRVFFVDSLPYCVTSRVRFTILSHAHSSRWRQWAPSREPQRPPLGLQELYGLTDRPREALETSNKIAEAPE
jgi:hypothetical protein